MKEEYLPHRYRKDSPRLSVSLRLCDEKRNTLRHRYRKDSPRLCDEKRNTLAQSYSILRFNADKSSPSTLAVHTSPEEIDFDSVNVPVLIRSPPASEDAAGSRPSADASSA